MRFGEILKTQEAEGKEKHVPVIEIKKCDKCGEDTVMVMVGKEVPSQYCGASHQMDSASRCKTEWTGDPLGHL